MEGRYSLTTLDLGTLVARRVARDDDLYERFAKSLEPDHSGEFVAIGDDGQLIRGEDELKVARDAVKKFGPGRFALRRIGADAEIRWRSAKG